ncbi:type I secretion system permease/ATPase [Allosphingosinicella indica]|uniref:ATP-binding cassette, subfamily C, LapB n=1 Tax=Allosphingosinicella indica TaxID=941907 RepID=A0A1X7G0E0_9SPHN|nr:type I secretion system permease/ATPase [Allosphingosinicella indica]SMF61825.1 ATP-binding cassette, subfamily C, LapB [Allosphingosinicella indica]
MSDDQLVGEREGFAPWLLEPMRRNKDIYIKVTLAAVLINIFALTSSLFTMVVYDRVLPNNATSSLVALSIGFALIVIFDFILKMLRSYFVDVAGARIDREVGESVFDRLLNIRLDRKRGSTGALAGIVREQETLRDFFTSATLSAVVDVPFILLTMVVIAIIGGWLVLVPIVLVPLVILVGIVTQPAMERLATRAMSHALHKQSVLVETIGGLETVKTAGASPILTGRWLRSIEDNSDISLRQRLIANIGITASQSAQMVSFAAVVVVGVEMIANRTLTMGGLIACSILAGRAVAPLGTIAQLLSRITATRTAYRQLNHLMQGRPEGPDGDPLRLAKVAGKIEFRNVHFRYPGTPEKALENINFTINPGEHVALIGRVGSGKTTIAKLLLGLYEPEEGVILLDGTDIRQLDPVDLRRKIASVMQDTLLLSGSVRENIALGREEIDDPAMLEASELAGTHQFIGQIANGYDRRLADRGEGLSGGQRQSIVIARALAAKPPVLVFDEPSSGMDTQTENGLIERLDAELKERTFIVITHRTPFLRLTSRVILMDRGKVLMDGPRDAVLDKINPARVAKS